MGIHRWLDRVKSETALPQVLAERCVHSLIEQASCRACVDACPRAAWLLDDEELGLDTEACDGCGLCVPACPQAAIEQDHRPRAYQYKGQRIALAACERAGVSGDGVMPCVHSLGLAELLGLYGQGVRKLLFARGDCKRCERSAVSRSFADLTENLRRLIRSHGLSPLSVREHAPREWEQRREFLSRATHSQGLSRRGFMREVLGEVVEHCQPSGAAETGPEQAVPLSDILPEGAACGLFPHVPHIDPVLCLGCSACVSLCPHGAIALYQQPTRYAVEALRCSGCGVCVDVCDAQAVTLAAWRHAEGQVVELLRTACDVCGAPFLQPTAREQEHALCQACTAAGRKKWHLFQVLGGELGSDEPPASA